MVRRERGKPTQPVSEDRLWRRCLAAALGLDLFAPMQRHRQAAARPQGQAALRLDLHVLGHAHLEALGKDSQAQDRFLEAELQAGANAGPLAKGM